MCVPTPRQMLTEERLPSNPRIQTVRWFDSYVAAKETLKKMESTEMALKLLSTKYFDSSKVEILLCVIHRSVSSAKKCILNEEACGRSLMYKRKSSSLSVEP